MMRLEPSGLALFTVLFSAIQTLFRTFRNHLLMLRGWLRAASG
jgi:hypothetical protein